MTRLPGLLAVGLLAGGALVFAANDAAANWPMSRHDAQRTAAVKGKSNITKPEPTWRFPLGGSLYYTQQLIEDADADGVPEFYFVRGSAAFGKRIDDTQMWQTPSMGVNAFLALADLDGDSHPEIVLTIGTNQVAVVNALTGEVDWQNPAPQLGARGTVLVGDLTGDGLPEVLLQDCGCCAEIGTIAGAVYSFVGNAKMPSLLWQLPQAACGAGNSTTLLDADGDGFGDVLLGRVNGFDLLAGDTGQIKASINYGNNLQVSQCVPAEITGTGEQAVCVFANGTTDDSGHRVFALSYAPGPSPSLAVLWDQKLGALDNAIAVKPGMVADLDGDGLKEVVVTAATSPSAWSTYVLDAAGGAVLATLDGHKLIATAVVVAGGRSLILTEEGDGFGAWSFKRTASPMTAMLWQVPGQGPLTFRDYALSMRAYPTFGLLALDLTGDGTPDLITGDGDGTLRVLDTSQGAAAPPPVVGTLSMPPFGSRLGAAPAHLAGKPVLVTEWSDGKFRMHGLQGGSLVELSPPGVHFGGLYNIGYWRSQEGLPIVASLGPGEPDSVLVTDASRVVHALDVSHADAMTPPTLRWSIPHAIGPVVVPNMTGGKPGVALIQNVPMSKPAKAQVLAVDGNGNGLWTSAFDGLGSSDLIFGNIDGDGVPDIIASWGMETDNPKVVRTRAISGATGATIWDGEPYPDGLMSGAALNDWNGDGRDDVYSEAVGLFVLSGMNGAKINPPPAEAAQNAMPMLVDINGDGKAEVVLQGGYARVTVLSSDLTTVLYKSDEVQSTIQYGALARCPNGPRLVESTYFYHTDRLTLTDLAPPQTGNMTAIYLAGGQIFPDEASATASGVFRGVLSAVSVHEDLTGLGHPSAVVGSNDGWLYAIDPCSGKLDFAYEFREAVGAVSFGDTNGDGLDEMIVEVADGYVYGMRQKIDVSTGGSGGTGTTISSSVAGGAGGSTGGVGGAGGSAPTTGGSAPEEYLLYGRACTCSVPGDDASSDDGGLALLIAGALAAAGASRKRGRRASIV